MYNNLEYETPEISILSSSRQLNPEQLVDVSMIMNSIGLYLNRLKLCNFSTCS